MRAASSARGDGRASGSRTHGEEHRAAARPSARRITCSNLLAAVAAAAALGITPTGELEVAFSALRGERVELAAECVLINDCYNANPMSMRAALEELAASAAGRRVAVLGDMLELGPEGPALHREIGGHAAPQRGRAAGDGRAARGRDRARRSPGEAHSRARRRGGRRAARRACCDAGDTVLVKGSRGVGLERVARPLRMRRARRRPAAGSPHAPVPGQR